jgi:hypothetical protein
MKVSVKPSERRQFRDGSGDFTCVGLNEIEVEVHSGPAPIRLFRNRGEWQPLEGVYELLDNAVGGPANAVLCHYGPMRGILVYGGPLGLNLAGDGVPVIWTQDVDDLPPEVQKQLEVEKFSKAS